jgi:hypothetical protein
MRTPATARNVTGSNPSNQQDVYLRISDDKELAVWRQLPHQITASDEDHNPVARKDNKYEDKDNDQPTVTPRNQNNRLPKDPPGKKLAVQKMLRQSIVTDDDQKPAAPTVNKERRGQGQRQRPTSSYAKYPNRTSTSES